MNVDLIKQKKIISLVTGVSSFLGMLLFDSWASMGKSSAAYYWSSDIRGRVSICLGLEVFCGIVAVIMIATFLFLFYLEKKGKVCPVCKMVYVKSTTRCLQCKNDITDAKSVVEYWAESPIVKKNMSTTGTHTSFPAIRNNTPDISREKFCPSCGHKMRGADRFCPKCGQKNEEDI